MENDSALDNDLPDLVLDYQLCAMIDGLHTLHTFDETGVGPLSNQLECWTRTRVLGHGGQGTVTLETLSHGKQARGERAVRIIQLQDGIMRRRYLRELEPILKFSHRNFAMHFVKMLGWYHSDESLYIAMEYFPAGDLGAYLENNPPLPEDDCRQIISQILSALSIMHNKGFANRDIKPQNIFIYRYPQSTPPRPWWVKVANFGISKRVTEANDGTASISTLLYMAPEIIGEAGVPDNHSQNQAADMWALGVTTLFLLTKSLPFKDLPSLLQYANSSDVPFPGGLLNHHEFSKEGRHFINSLMKPEVNERLGVEMAIRHEWISTQPMKPVLTSAHSGSLELCINKIYPDDGGPSELGTQASAAWSADLTSRLADASNSTLQQNTACKIEETPLWLAATNGEEVTVRLLLEEGAELEAQNQDYETAVWVAASKGHEPIVKLLIENGAKIEARNINCVTPLMAAVCKGHVAVAKLLVAKGADLEAHEGDHVTPLLIAMWKGNDAMVELLVENGANLEAHEGDYMTPLLIATLNGKEAMARLLIEKGAYVNPYAILLAAKKGNEAVAKLLAEEGAWLEIKNRRHETPLLVAMSEGNDAVAKVLIEKGAKVEAKNQKGWTPLKVALRDKNKTLVKLLRAKGAKIDLRDRFFTPRE